MWFFKFLYYFIALPYAAVHWVLVFLAVRLLPIQRFIENSTAEWANHMVALLVRLLMLYPAVLMGFIFWKVGLTVYQNKPHAFEIVMGQLHDSGVGKPFGFDVVPLFRVPFVEVMGLPVDLPLSVPLFLIVHVLATAYSRINEKPEVQQLVAGRNAEREVHNAIVKGFRPKHGWASFRNSLFVFNEGSLDEWSAEVDNIIVGQCGIYLIEAKYKSGTIVADPDSGQWTVHHNDRTSTMRNALGQVRNQCKVLRNHLDLHGAMVVPIVAIYGKDVAVQGPSNVVPWNRLVDVVLAFEHAHGQGNAIDFEHAVSTIRAARSTDKSAIKRHIVRAQAKRYLEESRELVGNAAV